MSEEGSEDSPSRPKRKIKKVMVLSSDSGSDSDEGVATAGTRRKRLRVLSDEGSDSSGSSVVCTGTRRKRALPKLRDSESDSDTSGWATDHSDVAKPTTSSDKPSGFASDSSEGNSDKCSICLLRFKDQEVGTPQSCEHIFCLDCIIEWSKNVNTCPVDRMTFDFIVVRACAGGRVLRNEPVKVVERRPSVEMLVIEDPTVCEVCGGTDSEETMLLCDGCDLGYHMACLTPPLSEVPANQWLCPNCDDLLSDVDILFSGITDMDLPLEARHMPTRTRSSRSSRTLSISEEPSTSSGQRGNRINSDDLPTTSRGSRTSQSTRTRSVTTRRKPTAQRRRHKRRRTKTVIIEYEVQENGKFPVTKRVKRKITKRKARRRQPRTAARRSHVRASVRAALQARDQAARPEAASASAPVQELSTRRHRAGIPALSLFGNPHEFEYFCEDDEDGISESASTAVAARPTSSILSAYRQARRKMISIPSPPHASSAPDVLSSILESQSLLHSKKSVISISVDGSVSIKVETQESTKLPKNASQEKEKKEEKLDLSKSEDASKKVPSYPGQSRGGRGWGGGYTGNYHREQNANNFNNRGNNYENNYGGGYQNRQGNSFHQQNNNMRRDDGDTFNNYAQRPQYSLGDDPNFERNRRQLMDQNRGPNVNNQRHMDQQQGRYSLAPSWQPYVPPAGPRMDPPPHHRHSFGGFENPLDMRVGQISRQNSANEADKNTSQMAKPYRPLPEPPMFKFDKTPEVEKSEDEKSDPGLVIDTEKYDPTEPTNDDESGDEDSAAPAPPTTPPAPPPLPASAPAPAPLPPVALPPEQHAVQNILAGLDTSTMNVPPNVLDNAVRAVLKEHRNLIVPAPSAQQDRSDDDSEGDCPNFSIYSATSVHIANNADTLPAETPAPVIQDNLEDLVQEDDDLPPDEPHLSSSIILPLNTTQSHRLETNILKKKSEEELKEKVSKRCPITTNPRNPIKIKLNTPSLIKRHMSLYDDEEEEEEEMDEDAEPVIEPANEMVTTPEHSSEKLFENVEEQESISRAMESPPIVDEQEPDTYEQDIEADSVRDKESTSPQVDDTSSTPAPIDTTEVDDKAVHSEEDDESEDRVPRAATPTDNDKSGNDTQSEDENDDLSEIEENDLPPDCQSPVKESVERSEDIVEKMTESISETEDERSYTPCLDENKSKDTSLETEKEKGIEGLDTEMISEDEGNEMFSDTERATSEHASPPRAPAAPLADGEEGEIVDKKKEGSEIKKKKKKDSKKEGKEKSKGKSKKGEIAFKKLSKSGKERNYRERDKDKEKNKRERRDSSEGAERERNKRRKERRKDLERYDVRTLVSEKRRRPKDAFGRDVSPREPSPPPRAASPRAASSPRATPPRARRASSSPRRVRLSPSPRRARPSPSPRSLSPRVPSPVRANRRRRRSIDKRVEPRRRRSTERARKRRRSPSASRSPRPKLGKRKKRARSSRSGSRRRSPRRRAERRRRLRRAERTPSRAPSLLPDAALGRSPGRSPGRSAGAGSVDSRLLSPRTPPPEPSPPEPSPRARRRRDPDRARHRRARDLAGPSKEVFTSGDNILVSVSFKEQERASGDERRERRRERRRRRRRAAAPDVETAAVKPVAIIDLERSPFRELTPSPRNVIVLLSDDETPHVKEANAAGPPSAAPAAESAHGAVGPKTPPEPAAAAAPVAPGGAEEARGPLTPPEPPDSPDAYDPYEPTRSASASPASPASARAASPPRALMTLEAAQKTNLSADDVIDRRPLSPIEKVMALLQSTRDVPPDAPPPGEVAAQQGGGDAPGPAPPAAPPAPPPAAPGPPPATAPAPPVRIVLPSPTRAQAPKLFLAKPSPIKSDPIKPMPAAKITRAAPPVARRGDSDLGGDSPYSPGSSDFGDLFEPPGGGGGGRDAFDAILERPARTRKRGAAAKVPVKLNRKKGKTQVGVKIDEDNLKILDDLPSSAVEMQVKSKFLKKLNRQERVVEEVKLVLKPHYNKKHVSKDEYKHILRRTVPKICHNKTGEINPSKIQALVEAYVKKFRKKHKLGLV